MTWNLPLHFPWWRVPFHTTSSFPTHSLATCLASRFWKDSTASKAQSKNGHRSVCMWKGTCVALECHSFMHQILHPFAPPPPPAPNSFIQLMLPWGQGGGLGSVVGEYTPDPTGCLSSSGQSSIVHGELPSHEVDADECVDGWNTASRRDKGECLPIISEPFQGLKGPWRCPSCCPPPLPRWLPAPK